MCFKLIQERVDYVIIQIRISRMNKANNKKIYIQIYINDSDYL